MIHDKDQSTDLVLEVLQDFSDGLEAQMLLPNLQQTHQKCEALRRLQGRAASD